MKDRNPDNFKLSDMALRIFKDLYTNSSTETITEAYARVAAEFGNNEVDTGIANDLLRRNMWRPNTPVWFSAGTKNKVFSACYVVSLEDSMNSIYDIANVARKIFQKGAGIGIPIGNLREKDALIYEGKKEDTLNGKIPIPVGKSSGPISFMHLYDAVGATTKSGGRARRAAIMVDLPISHPDIMDFIQCKEVDGSLSNMNISVAITDKFMQAFKDNIPFQLVSPSGEITGEIPARQLWDTIIDMAWKTADPGIIFIDTVNKYNSLKKLFPIECSNPCGEQYLQGFSACNLSSINLHAFCKSGKYDMKELYQVAYQVAVLMDNLIDKMDFPDERFKIMVRKYRPFGIGFMGAADTLFELGLPYDSVEGRTLIADCMKTITTACVEASSDMAVDRGTFTDYNIVKDDLLAIITEHTGNNEKIIAKVKKQGLRNSQFTTVAPTGTTALSCDCSYGIEPSFGLVFTKTLAESGDKYLFVNPIFQNKYEKEPWYTKDIIEKIEQNKGSLKSIRGIPKEVRDIFVTAHDIKFKDRIDMQAGVQKYTSNAISSTLNLPSTATREEVSELYRYAYEKGLKGVTIYRDGSKHSQPITFSKGGTEVKSNFPKFKKLVADRHELETGNGKVYVIISKYNNKPVEVFMNMGKSGQLFNVFSEALGRVISIALQHGVPVDVIVKTMIGINSDRPIWHRFDDSDKKPAQILSIPDGIAKLLQRYYLDDGKENIATEGYELCPKCGTYSAVKSEGCLICQNCGESACH
jgi:ribonucleoside-diphosphate reductase alpha chain